MRKIGSLADRLLGVMVPKGRAEAASCWYEQCGGRHSRYCCYYPDSNVVICDACLYRP
ncbi:hypothetical protein ABZU32_00930 [Sphaerisporangium sp. NPDC005288]|uniref:Uncharacterized protein n=1 Tax=Sphaerisporangium rhizosphaerae TaxID=2269375 RepID=A0ABW2NVN9_9ACTN